MEPVFPMEPVSSHAIPQGGQWLAQVKWDGVRILTYAERGHVRLFNRKKNERTYHYPEITTFDFFAADSVILDGEVIAMGQDGIPSFHEVMRRDGLRNLSKVKAVQPLVPISYMVFDILYLDGKWVTDLPLVERLALIEERLTPTPYVQAVTAQKDGEALFEVMSQYGMEGLVVKDESSPYLINEKKPTWQKIKIKRDVNAVVGGYTLKNGVANALLIGLYDDQNRLWYIGHVGTGKLTKAEWRDLTTHLKSFGESEAPFVNPPGQTSDTYWVSPKWVCKIHFAEWTEGRSLRQPSIQAFLEIDPRTCTFQNEAPEMRKG
ncbi:non-homologous end-joining DNA ligase [Pullulanibacillus sp. KACC 23026]|uniref:non-homologous end-joining DNA ligase n=1 Tax=Pullulanibacillus sp. KACC 23026 TaxID=3028315 RepID=UPI0023B13697|nr:non-homologous end-joining DNA ligase [Pullulanibacillus sp. KACC 23026]WEG11951.1 non-homologous end-joining DNA ligase [Pullulanibacillus sp. KACC 23026]